MSSSAIRVAKPLLQSLFDSAYQNMHAILLADYPFLSEDVTLAMRLDDCLMWLWAWGAEYDKGDVLIVTESDVELSSDKSSILRGIFENISAALDRITRRARAKVEKAALAEIRESIAEIERGMEQLTSFSRNSRTMLPPSYAADTELMEVGRLSTPTTSRTISIRRPNLGYPRIDLKYSVFAKYFYARWPRLYLASLYVLELIPIQSFEALDILNGIYAPIQVRDSTRVRRLNMVVARMNHRLRQWNSSKHLLLGLMDEKQVRGDGKAARPGIVKTNNYDKEDEYPPRKYPDICDLSENFHRTYPSAWNSHPWAPQTCDWLLDKREFRDWRDLETGRSLFILAGPGRGKSILAEFIRDHLRCRDSIKTDVVVNFSFYQSSWIDRPEDLLRHVIYHIMEKFPEGFARIYAIVKPRGGQQALHLWTWELLEKLRQSITFKLYFIIDTVDEYWNNAKDDQKRVIESFITKLCSLCDDNRHDNGTAESNENSPNAGIMKILFTSRDFGFLPELEKRSKSSVFLRVSDTDLHQPVERFIKTYASEVFSHKQLSDDKVESLLNLLINRTDTSSESIFLYAYLVIEETRKVDSKKDVFQACREVIQHYKSSSFDKIYERELLRIVEYRPKSNISSIIAESLKILYFAETPLTLNQLKSFLALRRMQAKSESSFWTSVPDGAALRSDLQQWCGVLITIRGEDVRLSHHTVNEYLESLQDKRLGSFSCHYQEAGIQMMATLCIRFLTTLKDLTQALLEETEALDNQQEDRLLALWETSFFTVMNWEVYVKALENLKTLWPQLSKFLGSDSPAYTLMLSLRWRFQKVDNLEDSPGQHQYFQPVGNFLAENGMTDILKTVKFAKSSSSRVTKSSSRPAISDKLLRLLQQNDYKQRLTINIDEVDEFGNTMLHYAAANDSEDVLRILLKEQADGFVYNEDGATPFRQAVASHSKVCADALIIANQAAKEKPNRKAISTAQFFAHLNWVDTMGWALNHGWHVEDDVGLNYWPPLYVAARFGTPEMVSYLIDHGADPGRPTRIYQDTAVHAAVEAEKLQILKLLLGDKPVPRANSQDDDGITPIYRAAFKGNYELFELLHSHQLAVKRTVNGQLPVHAAANSGSLRMLRYLLDSREDLSAQDHQGRTILHHAAAKGYLEIVEFCILRLKMDVNHGAISVQSEKYGRSDKGNRSVTPLACAVESGKREVVEFLLHHGANLPPNFPRGDTVLHSAANSGDVEIFKTCLQTFDLDPMMTNLFGVTPLHIASNRGHADFIRYFHSSYKQEKGFNIDQSDDDGFTCLHHAIMSSKLDAVDLLIKVGAKPLKVSKSGASCLIFAISQKNNEIFDRIFELDSQVYRLDLDCNAPIHHAGFWGNAYAIRRLCEHGADPNHKDNFLYSPLGYVLTNGYIEAFDALISAGASIFHRDCTGVGILDRVNSSSPLWRKLEDVMPLQSLVPPLEAEEKGQHIMYYIQEGLRVRRKQLYENPTCSLWDIAGLLLNLDFQSLEVESDIKILIEAHLKRMVDGRTISERPCRSCESYGWYGSAYVCRTCWHLRLLCEKCYCRKSRGMSIEGCLSEHDYMMVGDESWRHLPPDTVNEEGESFDMWFQKFERRYSKNTVKEPDHPLPAGIDEVMEVVRNFLTKAY